MEDHAGGTRRPPSKSTPESQTPQSADATFTSSTEAESASGRTASGTSGSGPVRQRTSNGGRGWTGMLKDAASNQISSQKHRASEGIDGVARALRETTDRLQQDGRTTAADYARQAAGQLEQFSRRLDDQNLDDMLRSAQRFAQSQPWVFIGAAFGIGLCAARFFKSSSLRQSTAARWESQGGTLYAPPMSGPSYGGGDYGPGAAL